MFEELALKKKWSSVAKNPEKAIKQQHFSKNQWNLLNHLKQSTVEAVVTDSILLMDKRACDNLLNAILKEK